LAQVLASIQTQLLGDPEPFFSDGFNHDTVRGTPAGEKGSQRFNNKIRLHTLRHAMIDHLRKPALGFDEVTKRHFTLCRKRILAQARRWTVEANGTPLFKSFVKAYEELTTLLSSKDLVYHRLPGQSEDPSSPWGAVPLDVGDLRVLSSIDTKFVREHNNSLKDCSSEKEEEEDSKPSAAPSMSNNVAGPDNSTSITGNNNTGVGGSASGVSAGFSGYNPWAPGATGAVTGNLSATNSGEMEDDDDFDELYT